MNEEDFKNTPNRDRFCSAKRGKFTKGIGMAACKRIKISGTVRESDTRLKMEGSYRVERRL